MSYAIDGVAKVNEVSCVLSEFLGLLHPRRRFSCWERGSGTRHIRHKIHSQTYLREEECYCDLHNLFRKSGLLRL
jgi:hypothetical protein